MCQIAVAGGQLNPVVREMQPGAGLGDGTFAREFAEHSGESLRSRVGKVRATQAVAPTPARSGARSCSAARAARTRFPQFPPPGRGARYRPLRSVPGHRRGRPSTLRLHRSAPDPTPADRLAAAWARAVCGSGSARAARKARRSGVRRWRLGGKMSRTRPPARVRRAAASRRMKRSPPRRRVAIDLNQGVAATAGSDDVTGQKDDAGGGVEGADMQVGPGRRDGGEAVLEGRALPHRNGGSVRAGRPPEPTCPARRPAFPLRPGPGRPLTGPATAAAGRSWTRKAAHPHRAAGGGTTRRSPSQTRPERRSR